MRISTSAENSEPSPEIGVGYHLWSFLRVTIASVLFTIQASLLFIKKLKPMRQLGDRHVNKDSIKLVNTKYDHNKEACQRPVSAVWDRMLDHPIAKSIKLFMEFDRGPIAIIIVGSEKVQFCMPMSLILHYSGMAVSTLNGGFSEAGSNIIRLPDHEPETFGLFKAYLFHGELGVHNYCHDPLEGWSSLNTLAQTCLLLCKLYVLIDYLDSRHWNEMEDDILLELQVKVSGTACGKLTPIFPEIALYVFRNTSSDSKLRFFVIEHICTIFSQAQDTLVQDYEKCIEEFPAEFGAEVIRTLILSSRPAPETTEDV